MKEEKKKLKLAVYFDVYEEQAIALRAMFEYWNFLGGVGSSRWVSFYVDGDGSFHPNIEIVSLTPNMNTGKNDKEAKQVACIKDEDGNKKFDFDSVIGLLRKRKEEWEKKLKDIEAMPQSEQSQSPPSGVERKDRSNLPTSKSQ